MEYWDKLKEHGNLDGFSSSPLNIVKVYKDFLKEETLIDTELYDKMYPKNDQVVVDADFVEIENVESDDIER